MEPMEPRNENHQAVLTLATAFEMYSSLADSESNETVRVGRRSEDACTEPMIWEDINFKLRITPGERGADIGCGCGVIARLWYAKARSENLDMTLVDFPSPIRRLQGEMADTGMSGAVRLVPGIFPDRLPERLPESSYDFVVMYGAVQCSDDPSGMVDAAVRLLRPGGRLLVGDLSNLSKKGRFLATDAGWRFDALYRSIPLSEAVRYTTHQDFVETQHEPAGGRIDDAFVMEKLRCWRNRGMDAYIVPQPSSLPFSFTREDLLIVRPGKYPV
jgi:SAM-dependent methyltransferase